MRALVLFAIGAPFIAFAIGVLNFGEDAPGLLLVASGLIGALCILAGISNLRFAFRRKQALTGGRERDGTLRLRGDFDEGSTTAFLIFSTSYAQWIVMLSPGQIRQQEDDLREGMQARATFGENERIYALTIGGEPIALQNEGVPFEGSFRTRVEEAEKRLAETKSAHQGKVSN